MVVFSLPSIRSYVLLECTNIIKGRIFCTKAGSVTSHFDESEVKHHESLAKHWWNPHGPMKMLHAMNDLRIPFIKNGLVNSHRLKALEVKNKVKFLEGVKILDVGCGGGLLSEGLARVGASVTGLDPSEELVRVARAHSATQQHTVPPLYEAGTIEHHAHTHRSYYDAVVASEVIEHVPHAEAFLAACIASLNLGGSIFITTPNRTLASWFGGILLAENVLRILPRGSHSYSKFIKPSELMVWLEKYGCSVQLCNGIFYDPFTNKWMWSPTKAFIYGIHAIKIADFFK